jgi:hypothetical protein
MAVPENRALKRLLDGGKIWKNKELSALGWKVRLRWRVSARLPVSSDAPNVQLNVQQNVQQRSRAMPDFLTRRDGTWHFVRRVPAEFLPFDRRGIVRHSTRVRIEDDRNGRRASRVAERFNEQLVFRR